MTPITITIDGQAVDGYFYAAFAGVWVLHPTSNGKGFSRVRGFAPEIQAAKLLHKLATRAPGSPCEFEFDAPPEALEWHCLGVATVPASMESDGTEPADLEQDQEQDDLRCEVARV